jgi:AcrR family transcriptional regulator
MASGTRDLIMQAAAELFYGEGILRSSMDAIAERAGVTKRTLYHHFRSKDDLVAAWLAALDDPVRQRYRGWLHATGGPIDARVEHMFNKLAVHASNPRWKGCGFSRAASELAGLPGHPGLEVARRHRAAFEAWFVEELAAEGIASAAAVGRRLMLLLDGAVVQAMIHHDTAYIVEAGAAAADLVAQARRASGRAPARRIAAGGRGVG